MIRYALDIGICGQFDQFFSCVFFCSVFLPLSLDRMTPVNMSMDIDDIVLIPCAYRETSSGLFCCLWIL